MNDVGSWDYMAGRWAADREANNAIASWKKYSEKLEGKFAEMEWKYAKAESERVGFGNLYKTFREELQRVDPNNPLLQRDTQIKILNVKIAERATELGYHYDPNTESLVKKR